MSSGGKRGTLTDKLQLSRGFGRLGGLLSLQISAPGLHHRHDLQAAKEGAERVGMKERICQKVNYTASQALALVSEIRPFISTCSSGAERRKNISINHLSVETPNTPIGITLWESEVGGSKPSRSILVSHDEASHVKRRMRARDYIY